MTAPEKGTFSVGLVRGLPRADFSECHERMIASGPQRCLDAVERFRTEDDAFIRTCLTLRDLPGRMTGGKNAHRFGMESFTPLGRIDNLWLGYGLVGRFWQAGYGLASTERTAKAFWEADGRACRLLLTFATQPASDGVTRLVTRTEISCPDPRDRRKMTLYWLLIRPVSGIIRRRILRAVEMECMRADIQKAS